MMRKITTRYEIPPWQLKKILGLPPRADVRISLDGARLVLEYTKTKYNLAVPRGR